MHFIDLQAQYNHLKDRIDERIHRVLDHGRYIMGPEVNELEDKLAQYVGVKHAITCANGTDALTLAMMAIGVSEGDAVFCPTFTFFATAETIAYEGATPVFVDSDRATYNICTRDLEDKIKKVIKEGLLKPKAIISVDLFGLPANYPEIALIAKKYGLKVIEDAAQGFGGTINGERAGSFGDLATTSFFPAKPLGCYGDGGAIFTDDDEYAELIKSYRVHGKGSNKYDNVRIGMNSRLDTIQAAILLEKLAEFPTELANRNIAAENYNSTLNSEYILPLVPDGYTSSWAQYSILVERREEVIKEFTMQKIPTMIYYEKCLHLQEAFRYLGYSEGDFPVAESISRKILSLPMHGYLSK
ncbi:DegT/DnrJ/EryC1/StrS aminotransferase family protein [Vibrio tubiashii]|uniref:Aminotransferase DegT n=1 Tax=Vibrio tubiashii ATCC 19109 TaxID=1051646 RepID=F9T0G9_9VIBR|nr:DegT/DnrJ/EryC1/StrS family aminotransferase [Vibrio tubiashii]AIW12754.1 aminotransferase DegT [Vibrio tubiashii ATCC 19109]EGU58729.1 DegT/DnrJ/EryC1/StrS family protein [Vibrio tubiashii ATCC 19109]EIF03102.1 DegT/DnrJ/EryC1/StrS family protein [Vibrio tubiashii NCIMB 1337 = ATCC 19106]